MNIAATMHDDAGDPPIPPGADDGLGDADADADAESDAESDGSPAAVGAGDAHDDDPRADPHDDGLPAFADAAGTVPGATEAELAAWIGAIGDHDERALTALYDATFTRVFGLVRRMVRDTGLAEEVVEDAYYQVWRQALRFDPARGRPLAWLLAIARSRAIDALRREARFEHEALDDPIHTETAGTTPPADELLELARHSTELHHALLRLGALPRQMVSLSFFRGLSHEEIAEQMGLPLGTVKSQIRRALLALRKLLGDAVLPRLVS